MSALELGFQGADLGKPVWAHYPVEDLLLQGKNLWNWFPWKQSVAADDDHVTHVQGEAEVG